MTKLKVGLVLGLATILILAASSAQAEQGDAAAGRGRTLLDVGGAPVFFGFAAHGEAMTAARGHMTLGGEIEGITESAQARVTCLFVVGNRAAIGGIVTQATEGVKLSEGEALFFTVQDNAGLGLPDQIVFSAGPPGTDNTCPAFIGAPGTSVEHGNITVRDGSLM